MTRIAHFSDTHVLSLKGASPQQFLSKRWTGAVNLALNRSRHYRTEIFVRVLDAIVDLDVDHAICTGDLVNLALEPEFRLVAELFRSRFGTEALTVVPGNHDYYAKDAVADGLFERYFGDWLPRAIDLGGTARAPYPITRVLDDVFIIGINSSVPTPVFIARGTVDDGQLRQLRVGLEHPEAEDRFRLVMLHHPLLPEPARRLDATRRLSNADAVAAALRTGTAPHLVVHGHNHAFKLQRVPGTEVPLVQVASASRAGNRSRAEFNVYVIEGGRLEAIERHIHQPETGRFLACDAHGRPLAHAS